MTDNQLPQASARSPLDQYGNAAPTDFSAGPAGSASKKDTAKEEASKVAGQAAGGAQSVAQAAKYEVGHVASEAKSEAKTLLHQAKQGVGSQAGAQQQKAVDGVRTISSQLQAMADAPEQQGVASDLVREAANRASAVASWIEGKDAGMLLTDVQGFARRKPGTFLLISAGAGLLAGRLVRGLQAGAPAPQGEAAIPPRPEQPPAAAANPSRNGVPVYREPVAEPVAYGETIYGEPARPAYSGTEAGGVPLRDLDDPYTDMPGGGRQL
nr:hypothetical protein [Arthrobacter sp. AFG7.2]